MEIKIVKDDKKRYLDLLLLADEQEDMIDRYLERGELFVLDENGIKAVCVVTDNGEGVYEIKNLAVVPASQRLGYGKKIVEYVCNYFRSGCRKMLVGTGESPVTVPFYLSCGFKRVYRVKNFFTDNYNHPIFNEKGEQLKDMLYFEKWLR